ncbi:MAG TPA: MIP/aquaporin family protein [Thermaerobacter sp.]
MSPFLAELIGTMILILLGDGVVANVLLNRSKGQNGGWIVITTGWALAVAVGAYLTGHISGAHLNPAVTVGLAAIGQFPWADVPSYIIAQMIGAFLGAVLVYLTYLPHWGVTEDANLKLGVFCTAPAVRSTGANLITEAIGTAVLVLGVLGITHPGNNLTSGLAPLLVGFLVWSIGLSLGGPTGYAINPARDLGPRIAHAVLPIPGKRDSDWGYSWIPVVGPIIGGVLGAVVFQAFFGA